VHALKDGTPDAGRRSGVTPCRAHSAGAAEAPIGEVAKDFGEAAAVENRVHRRELCARVLWLCVGREDAQEEVRGEVEEAGGRRRVWRGSGGGGGGEAARHTADIHKRFF